MNPPFGHLSEIFLSFQGEGVHVGEAQVFLRLGGCSLRCRYCDTPDALVTKSDFQVATPKGPQWFKNPLAPDQVSEHLALSDPDGLARTLAVTGGEPLDQPEFLRELLLHLDGRYRIYLETAGVYPQALQEVIAFVDVVAMDMKLPSVAGEGDRFEEHRSFLEVAKQSEVMVKVIVSAQAEIAELDTAARLVADVDSDIPFILQPETNRKSGAPDCGSWVMEAFRCVSRSCRDVRLIPQTHKFLSIA